MPDVRFDSHTLTPGQLRSKRLNRKFGRSGFIDSITRLEWKIAIFVEFFPFSLNFCSPSWHDLPSCSHARLFSLSLQFLTCSLLLPRSLSPCVFRKAESYYALRVSAINHRLGLGRGKGTMWCGLFCVCVCVSREIMCGGGEPILGESVSCEECMLGCPGLTLPVCVFVCVCACIGWVRALLLSLVLIKEAFESVSKTTSAVAGDEKYSQTGGY